MAFETVATIVNDAAVDLGLGSVSDVFASTDPNVVQLRTLLTTTGRALVKRFPWTNTVREHTFTTDASASYALPADYRSLVAGSPWNRSLVRPMTGAVSSQEWQALKAQTTGAVLDVFFRIWLSAFYIYPSTNSGTSCAFEYKSSYWVQPTGQTTPTADRVSANTDTLCFDTDLMRCALKLRFLRAKGFDITAVQVEFLEALSDSMSDDAAGANLRLDAGPYEARLLDMSNAPASGFGLDGDGGLF